MAFRLYEMLKAAIGHAARRQYLIRFAFGQPNFRQPLAQKSGMQREFAGEEKWLTLEIMQMIVVKRQRLTILVELGLGQAAVCDPVAGYKGSNETLKIAFIRHQSRAEKGTDVGS